MSKKDIIYIDIEDDITAIIDKVKASKADIIALVPPKRSTVLQSAVNMKLLKKTSDQKSKKIVLITSESALLPLAGKIGLHVADSTKSRPHIPEVEKADIDTSIIEGESIDENSDDSPKSSSAKSSVGVVAAGAAVEKSESKDSEKGSDPSKKKTDSVRKSKLAALREKSKIPNFQRFQLRMVLGFVGLISLIVLWFVAFRILPRANVVVAAQTSRVPVDASFTIDTSAQTLDLETGTMPATQNKSSKTVTDSFDATGEKDVGEKATGVITVQNCDSSTAISVPSGTVFSDSTTGFSFTNSSAVSVPGGVFSGGGCSTPGEADVAVTAVESGDDKNLSARNYSVSGFSNTVTAFGDQMSGGTTKIVTVVSQDDVEKAAKKVIARAHAEERDELNNQFSDEFYVISETFVTNNDDPTSEPAVEQEATKATISVKFNYSMLGVQKSDLDNFLKDNQMKSLGEDGQDILDSGIESASLSVGSKEADTKFTVRAITNGFAGPTLDVEALKTEIVGKRFSEAVSQLESKSGVSQVNIELSPFWVSHVPSNMSKVEITIEVSDHTLQ